MSNQFEVNVWYANGKYYLYTLTSMDGEVYTDIKEYSIRRKRMTNLDAIKEQDAEQIADMIMQFINVSKFATTSKKAIIEWLNSNDVFLPFKSLKEGETE